MGKISKYVFYAVFGGVFIFVAGELFFAQQLSDVFKATVSVFTGGQEGEVRSEMDVLKVVYPDEPVQMEPTLADPTTRQRLNNIYESLVKTDRDLKIVPSLAVNWGLIDDYTWEFRLRSGVKFHDETGFDAKDVKSSLNRAMLGEKSELVGVLSTINEIEIKDNLTLRITTKTPDPLLLQRLSMILIIPSEYEDKEIKTPTGTGSYKFASWDPEEKIILERFDDYWGNKSKFETVELYVRVDKFERVQMLVDGEVDFMAFVPYDGVEVVEEGGFNIVTVPSLEVQFLVFNMQSEFMSDIRNRMLVSTAINQDDLITAVGGYARKVSQFVSSGVFGFNPRISDHVYDIDVAKEVAIETGITGKTVKFNLMKGLTVLGDYMRERMKEIGVNLVVSYLDGAELVQSMEDKKADIYFLGFKSEMGDASDFLYFIVHSDGPYNFWGYRNEYVDKLIDSSMVEMDMINRRKELQEIMKVLIGSDIFGVPLFEYEKVYAFNDKLDINPRIDGIIYFDELTVK